MVIHYVHDMDRATNFYKSVFDVASLFESAGWTQLDCGAVALALHILHPESKDPEAPLPHAGLNFEVDSIEAIGHRTSRWATTRVKRTRRFCSRKGGHVQRLRR